MVTHSDRMYMIRGRLDAIMEAREAIFKLAKEIHPTGKRVRVVMTAHDSGGVLGTIVGSVIRESANPQCSNLFWTVQTDPAMGVEARCHEFFFSKIKELE